MKTLVCEHSDVKPFLSDFVLWYNDCDAQGAEVWSYATGLGTYTLPLVCVIDPSKPNTFISRKTGYMEPEILAAILTSLPKWPPEISDDCDDFADAWPLSGVSGEEMFSNVGYTKEVGEPLHSSDGYYGGVFGHHCNLYDDSVGGSLQRCADTLWDGCRCQPYGTGVFGGIW